MLFRSKLSKEEAFINWHDSAEQIARNVRAFNPWPVAWTKIESQNIKIWSVDVVDGLPTSDAPGTIIQADKHGIVVTTGSSALRINTLQIPGKKALPAADVVNARKDWFAPGNCIASTEE